MEEANKSQTLRNNSNVNSMMDGYKNYLIERELAKSTVNLYVRVASEYCNEFGLPSRDQARSYRERLIEQYRPATVNLRINALNSYFAYAGALEHRVRCVKVQRRSYLEDAISAQDCRRLEVALRREGHMTYYFAVRVMVSTGVRVSELLELKVEHVQAGHLDVLSKGGKARRVFIPLALCREMRKWLASEGRTSGFVFLNARGQRITARGLSGQLKVLAQRCGIDPAVVYPHSFRHLFARNFLDAREDIALLADLMGHSSIETTRIYLRKTASEQRAVVEEVVTW